MKKYAYASTSRTEPGPPNNAGRAPRAIYESISVKGDEFARVAVVRQVWAGCPNRLHAGGPFSDRSCFRADRDPRSACQRLQHDAVALGRGNQIGNFLGSA
jgi:hypothetical protein